MLHIVTLNEQLDINIRDCLRALVASDKVILLSVSQAISLSDDQIRAIKALCTRLESKPKLLLSNSVAQNEAIVDHLGDQIEEVDMAGFVKLTEAQKCVSWF